MNAALKDGKAPVSEIFGPTVQGEGVMAGHITWFVRLSSCDYFNVCDKCDSMHAVDPRQWKKTAMWMTPAQIAEDLHVRFRQAGIRNPWVTFSGGNPALWDMQEAIDLLHQNDVKVAVETQGTKYLPWLADCDVLTVSPKGPGMLVADYASSVSLAAFNDFMATYYTYRHNKRKTVCVKVPVFNEQDLDFAEDVKVIADLYEVPLYLSVGNSMLTTTSLDTLRSTLLLRYERIVEQTMLRPHLGGAIVLPQLHVLIWGNKQGV